MLSIENENNPVLKGVMKLLEKGIADYNPREANIIRMLLYQRLLEMTNDELLEVMTKITT